tara:strand:+ start:719 stop:2290 length:1572 start_codon:yes stop_codon:yes gene_type:complete
MCGIFFIKNIQSTDLVKAEFNKASNRGPDDTKFINLDKYYIGFHRLSINGLDNISNQPFYKNGIYLICNGEIYNYKQLYNDIGIVPETNSDCEIILDLYMLYPISYFITLLDGVYSFIIYDTKKDIVTIGRDIFGVRPLFCSEDYEYFSSELKQINNLTDKTISQFKPGHYLIIDNNKNKIDLIRYYTLIDYTLSFLPRYKSLANEYNYYRDMIKYNLINAVNKRLLSDRPIACLLSGGLDSSIITSIVSKLTTFTKSKLETYSIGLKESTDLINANIVAKYLNTNHTEIILTEDEFFNAIPEVIEKIESYDTTTVRASVGNYLIAKYISNHSDAKVIFNGDGADELTGGYLYFNKAPNNLLFDYEIKTLLNYIHFFDVLRSDRCISSCGLEPRTPFLDKTFVTMYLSIPLKYRLQKHEIEKKILRDSFNEFLPSEILNRKKEAFSDGVSGTDRSWYKIIEEKLKDVDIPLFKYNSNYLSPKTKEQFYYRYIFEQKFPGREKIIPYFWMPKWSNTKDPSARTL